MPEQCPDVYGRTRTAFASRKLNNGQAFLPAANLSLGLGADTEWDSYPSGGRSEVLGADLRQEAYIGTSHPVSETTMPEGDEPVASGGAHMDCMGCRQLHASEVVPA